MAQPKVTVLMPVHNGERHLQEAIESVLGQTFEDFELLVLHDQSTDGTSAILEGYSDPRMRVVHNEEKLGLTRSLNKGLHLARGQYIARMDADDISLPERLELQARYLDEHPDTGLVTSAWAIINENGQTGTGIGGISAEALYYTLTFANCICHSSTMFRKSLALALGGYDPMFDLAEDLDLWYRISRRCKLASLPQILVKYRLSDLSVSTRFHAEQHACLVSFLTKHIEELMGDDVSIEDITCFQYMVNSRYARATYASFQELAEIHERIIESCPSWLDQQKLEQYSQAKLFEYLVIMIRHGHFILAARLCFHARFRAVITCRLRQKARPLLRS
jgi:glycosyltransferase involved in cell wall biosynthesis